tara:strand:+ start:991 stop:1371 length:381 start_codon:yes stop_codon:yes gene_type:complete
MTNADIQVADNFTLDELECNHCATVILSDLFWYHVRLLQGLRDELGPLRITSAYRCPTHNEAEGGAARSMHLEFATDVQPVRSTLEELYFAAQSAGFSGLGRYNSFVHLDCRNQIGRAMAIWDNLS